MSRPVGGRRHSCSTNHPSDVWMIGAAGGTTVPLAGVSKSTQFAEEPGVVLPQPVLRTGSPRNVTQLAAAGMGVTIAPSSARLFSGRCFPGRGNRGLADVHAHVRLQGAPRANRVQQQPGFPCQPQSQLDHRTGTRELGDPGSYRAQKRSLDRGRVVLGTFQQLLLMRSCEPGTSLTPTARGQRFRRINSIDRNPSCPCLPFRPAKTVS